VTPGRLLAVTVLVAGLAAGCERKPPAAVERPPAPVSVAPALTRDAPLYIDVMGKAVAQEVVSIQPQTSGRITAIHFADGADLKAGDRLFTIDPRPLQATLQQAEAAVARDEAQARQAEANAARDQAQAQQAQAALLQARAQLGQAEANVVRDRASLENARVQEQRYSELVKQGYVAREQADQVRTAFATAQATVGATEAMVENARAAIQAAEASLQQARAAVLAGQAAIENARAAVRADQAVVESARLQLGYTEIRAPVGGRAGQRLVDLGNIVTGNTGSLLTIQRLDPIYAEFTVTENDLGAVQRQMAQQTLRVEVRLPDEPEPPLVGSLTFVDNTVQEGTGTVKLRATVPNKAHRLWPGRFVRVRLVLGQVRDAVLVPAGAPQMSARGPFVYVVKPDATAELRPVTLGQAQGELIVVSGGLKAGERVVTAGHMGVAPGGKVQVQADGAAGAPGAAGRAPAGGASKP
jgi:multidrug efflux system membrane fusion protein